MARTSRNADAFSLLEMVIVMALVAIISAIAIPRYSSSLQNYRASFAARKIAADIAMAQNSARAVSASRTVVFTSTTGYGVSGVGAQDGGSGAYTIDLSADPFHASVKVDFAGTAQVTFDGYGHPDNAGSITVYAGQATRSITVDGQSGACTIQ